MQKQNKGNKLAVIRGWLFIVAWASLVTAVILAISQVVSGPFWVTLGVGLVSLFAHFILTRKRLVGNGQD